MNPTLPDVSERAMRALVSNGEYEALQRWVFFNRDVNGAAISFQLFDELRARVRPENPANISTIIYHASCFVCAVRRVWRLLASLSADGAFRESVAHVIRHEKRKGKNFYKRFVDPRNAIEHIDSEGRNLTRWFNLWGNRLEVVDGTSVEINADALRKVLTCRDSIAAAIVAAYPQPAS